MQWALLYKLYISDAHLSQTHIIRGCSDLRSAVLGLCHRTTGVPHGCCSNSGCTAHWIASSAAWENAVVSYPDLHSHTQTSILIPRPPLSYPDLHSHTQTSILIPRPPLSYPDLQSHTQTSTLIPRPPLSYPDLHCLVSYPDRHSTPLLKRPGDPSPKGCFTHLHSWWIQ